MTPSSGTGTGTPISSGAAAGISTAQPLPYTLLSLHRFARIMGIVPIHFAGASAGDAFPFNSQCNDIWHKYAWQDSDKVSHYELAITIADAEREIAEWMGFWPAPVWIEDEVHRYPRDHRRDEPNAVFDIHGDRKAIELDYGKLIQAGVRTTTLVGTATTAGGSLVYSDEDGDGFFETATVAMATVLTDPCEIKLYFAGQEAAEEWEVRPVRSKAISGGIFTAVLDSWILIDPELYEAAQTVDGPTVIDISTTANFVESVDVYHEYTDSTVPSAVFYWEPSKSSSLLSGATCSSCGGDGCPVCTQTTQNGCMYVRDVHLGIGVPLPAEYDGTWMTSDWAVCRAPDQVKVHYYAGDLSRQYLRGLTCEPLSDFWAKIIAEMAVARLERPFCSCGNLLALQERLREDLSYVSLGSGNPSRFVSRYIITSPFGTLRGEVNAWMRVSQFLTRRPNTAVI